MSKTGICLTCGAETARVKNIRCSNCYHDTQIGKPLSEEHKKNISLNHGFGMLGKTHSKETRIKMSISHKTITDETRLKLSITRKEHIRNCDGSCGSSFCPGNRIFKRSKIHQELYLFLTSLGWNVLTEKKFGKFSVDCYVPEMHLAFEADGEYWHSIDPSYDVERDRILKEMFDLDVIRYPEREIKNWGVSW